MLQDAVYWRWSDAPPPQLFVYTSVCASSDVELVGILRDHSSCDMFRK